MDGVNDSNGFTKKQSGTQLWEPSAAGAEERDEDEAGSDQEETAREEVSEKQEDEDPMKIVRNYKKVDKYPEVREFKVEKLPDYDYSHLSLSEKDKKSKFRMMKIKGFGLPPVGFSTLGLPSVDTGCLKLLMDGRVRRYFQ